MERAISVQIIQETALYIAKTWLLACNVNLCKSEDKEINVSKLKGKEVIFWVDFDSIKFNGTQDL